VTGIDYFAWVVFIVIIVSVVAGVIVLAQLPGKIALKNHHPQARAINVAGWLGLLMTLGFVWVLAMIWAAMAPADSVDAKKRQDNLSERINALEAKIRAMEEQAS